MSQIPTIHGLHVTYSPADKPRVTCAGLASSPHGISPGLLGLAEPRGAWSVQGRAAACSQHPTSPVLEPQAAPPQRDTSGDRFFGLCRCADKA